MTQQHDFDRFPELTNAQMDTHYFDSPHKQIFESFNCKVTKVHDGDTITVRWKERDFDFPIRFENIAAPEMSEEGGKEAQKWLEGKILNQEVSVLVNPRNRVEKWGRLLGRILFKGIDIGQEQAATGLVTTWAGRDEGKIPNINWIIPKFKTA